MKLPPGILPKIKDGLFGSPARACLTLLTISVYALLLGIYSNNDIDDSWSGAWIYNFWNYGISKDIVFRAGDESYWGVRFFSHIYCYVYGAILSITGFSKCAFHLISTACVALGLLFWTSCAQSLFKDKGKSLAFLFVLAWSGVVFAAANKTRSDAFVFMLMGLSLHLFILKRRFLSVFVACMAVETHPIGAMSFAYLFGYALFHDRDLLLFKDLKGLFRCVAALLCGLALYFLLHHEDLGSLKTILLVKSQEGAQGNFLAAHFWGHYSYSWRYLPDLLLFVSALVANIALCGRRRLFLPVLAALTVVASFVLKRGNFHYALFAYPAFIMLLVDSVSLLKGARLRQLVALWLLLMLPQYLFLTWFNWPGRQRAEYLSVLREAGIPKDARIYGMPADWFAFMDFKGFRVLSSMKAGEECYIVKHDGTPFAQPDYVYKLDRIPKGWRLDSLKTVKLRAGGSVEILKLHEAAPEKDSK